MSTAVIITSDCLGAGTVTFVFFFFFRRMTAGRTNWYLVAPTILMWTHVTGNAMQEIGVGPNWIQDHLHDVGVATFALIGVYYYLLFRSSGQRWLMTQYVPSAATMIVRAIPIAHLVGTLVCVLSKVADVTIFRQRSMAQGYSGQLDFGDLSMFLLGFAIILVNHFVMRRGVLAPRKPKRPPIQMIRFYHG